ncbi:hypothetical protein MFLAVUS_003430 [Mucor flavus]|uniref:Uncharacterized protein n=1 Tax=Mucor flavus TaxID=439312 RepID=A0ABP9YT36_9FUNG
MSLKKFANRDFYGIDKDIWSELVEESMEEYSRLEGTIDDVSTFDRIIKTFKKKPQKSTAEASLWFSQCKAKTNDYSVAKALLNINTDESAGSKDRKKDHERIPDLTRCIHVKALTQSSRQNEVS